MKKSVVLIVSMLVMTVLLVLSGAYFSAMIVEKRLVDREKYILQALSLAEAGANHALSELRKKIRIDLPNKIRTTSSGELETYAQNPLGLLVDYLRFSLEGNKAKLDVPPLNLSSNIKGSYNATISVSAQNITPNPKKEDNDKYIFYYNYKIESIGTITETKPPITKTIILSGGSFSVTVSRSSFAKFALFTNHQSMPNGNTVWFTANTNFTGPIHTNDRFSFAGTRCEGGVCYSGTFTDAVTQHLPTARFYNQGWQRLLDADSNPPYDVPNFSAGFSRGEDLINLPSSVTQKDLKDQATGRQNDGPWAGGIYLPNQGGNLVGGIYIKGDVSNLTMSVDENNRPVYTITYGTNTKKITIDYTNNQTIVTNLSGTGGTPAGIYNGIPDGIGDEGIIIYSNGKINNFSGTVQSDTKLIVSSDSDIVINNHILYQSYNPGPPLNATGYNNLLGILTWNGNVRISTTAPNDLNIHAVVMANRGVFTVDNYQYGSPRGTVTLLGGVITDFYGAFGTFSGNQQLTGYGRNFVYDSRMLEGIKPPYFPYMSEFTSFEGDQDKDGIKDLNEKLIWQEKVG